MNYGLYLSATGIMASSYKQDVISNNLANAETNGFKRDLAVFHERRTEAKERGAGWGASNDLLENLTGGMLASPTLVDHTQGDLETTGRGYDCAIEGKGYFMVDDHGTQRLTRNGQFMTNASGALVLGDGTGEKVLDPDRKPIVLDPQLGGVQIGEDGGIMQNQKVVARVGVFDVADQSKLTKHGGTLMDYPDAGGIRPTASAQVRGGFLEHSNVDPATELSQLMSTQRELEANANMIRYQDQTLSRLVNDVAKVG